MVFMEVAYATWAPDTESSTASRLQVGKDSKANSCRHGPSGKEKEIDT